MLNFCAVTDVTNILPTGQRFDDYVADVINGVTLDFNQYMRRTFDYEAGIVDLFDIPMMRYGERHRYWLKKQNLDAGTVVKVDQFRVFDATTVYPNVDDYSHQLWTVDTVKGVVTLYQPPITDWDDGRRWLGCLQISYGGGYPADKADNTIFDYTIAPFLDLKAAAITECVQRLNRSLNLMAGDMQMTDRRQRVVHEKPLVGNLMQQTAAVLDRYRRPLGKSV
jgi:hypothetical protein